MADDNFFARAFGFFRTGEAVDTPAAEEQSIAKASAIPNKAIGSTGVFDMGGYVVTSDRDPELTGPLRYDVYDRMLRDTSIVAAGVRLFLNLLANADWTVNPAEGQEDNPKAQEIADLAYSMLFDMTSSWSTVVRKTAMYRFQGFAVLEWTAKRRTDGAIGLMDVESRPQRTITRWNLDPSGTVQGVYQLLPKTGEVEIPRSKVVYAVDDTLTESPEGLGLFRQLAHTAERLRRYVALEEIGYETDLRGIPIARAPLGELRTEVQNAEGNEKIQAEARRATLLRPLKEFIDKHMRSKSSGMLVASDTYVSTNADSKTVTSTPKWALELLNGDSTSFSDEAKAIDRLNQELARVLGVEHLLLGAQGQGSLALAQSKVGTFYLTLTSTLLDLVEIYERDLLDPLAALNGWPEELIPTLGVNEIRDQDIEAVGRVLSSLAMAGAPMTVDDPAVGEIRDLLGLSRPPQEQIDRELDASLNPQRNNPNPNPADPNAPTDPTQNKNPEDGIKKRNMITSRRAKARAAAATKRAA